MYKSLLSQSLLTLMTRLCLSASLLLASIQLFAQEQNSLAIINAVIIDGNGKTPISNASILIQDGKITDIGKKIPIPKGTKTIDAQGKVAMPGLADMHVHLSWGGEKLDLLGYQKRLNASLYAGVTTTMDMGGVLPFVQQIHQAIENKKIPGPYLYYVGPLIDSPDPSWPSASLAMASKDQATTIAKYLKKNGASAIKAYGNLSSLEYRSLVWAGKEQGLPVFIDAWLRNGAEHLVGSGLRAFAHTPSRLTDDTIKTMQNKNVFIITTLTASDHPSRARYKDLSFLQDDLIQSTTTQWQVEAIRQEAERKITDQEKQNMTYLVNMRKSNNNKIKKLHQAGITLVAGTDSPGIYGEQLHRELELLVAAGLTPLEAITTASKNAALLMKDEDKWGTLEKGKRADILLINGRPDKNISDTRKIVSVIQQGVVIDREKLKYKPSLDNDIRPSLVER